MNLKSFSLVICLSLISSFQISAQDGHIDDGPYFFQVEESIIGMWIENGGLSQSVIAPANFPELKSKFDLKFDYEHLKTDYSYQRDYKQLYSGIETLAALSDIHGQYDLYIRLLKANKIIDENLNWIYGNGHLVIVGDVFDRGDEVTEVLWHIFGLEKQAEQAGGKVHMLLGNHEVMVLNNDLRYVHDKYKTTEALTNTTYNQLYSENTILGQWLRSKPVVIHVNNMIFNHAGLSTSLVNEKVSVEKVNSTFSTQILGRDKEAIISDEFLELMYRTEGPIWYRGYFYDETFTEHTIDSVLNYYDVKHVIAGHCSYDSVVSRFNKKIIGVDTSIKNGEHGELLIYHHEKGFFRGTLSGKLKPID